MKKHYLLLFFLLSYQSTFAIADIIEMNWENKSASQTTLDKDVCGQQDVRLNFRWDANGAPLKADDGTYTTDVDVVNVNVYEEISGSWQIVGGVPGTGDVILTITNTTPTTQAPQTGTLIISTGYTNNTRKFKLVVTKTNYILPNTPGKVYFKEESKVYTLNSTVTPMTLSSELKAGSQTFQSSSAFSGSNIVCDHDLIMDKIKWNKCAKQYVLYLHEVNPLNGQTTAIKTVGPASISGLSPTINLNNIFGNQLQKGKLYRINLKVGNGNGAWTSVNNNVYYINYYSTKNPTISINTPHSICIGTAVTITLNDPPNNFQWTSTSGSLPTGISSTITPTQTGVYNITTNDHCVNLPNDLQISVKSLPTVDLSNNQSVHCTNVLSPIQLSANVSPTGGTGVWSINQGLINPSTGVFNPAQNTIPNHFVATYTYTAPNGCTQADNFSFDYYDPSTFSTTVNNLTCYNSNDGAIFTQATGTPPYNFSLNGTAQAPGFTGLAAGTYQVELNDGHGCITTENVTVSQPQALSASLNHASPYTVPCYGAGLYVQVTNVQGGTGTYLYNFGNGFTSNSGQLLYPQSSPYQIQVKDQNGCIKNLSFQLNAPPTPITATANTTNPTCYGIANGSIALTINGGTAPYNVSWNNGTIGNNNTSLAAGTHTYTITDANGCHLSKSITLSNGPSGISANATITNSSCHGTNDGAISLNYNSNYSYAWSTGAVGNSIANLVDNNYNVTLTNNTTGNFYGCKTIKHYAVATNNQSYWHKNTINSNGGNDQIIKVITDANNNVYALGEYDGETEIDGVLIEAGNNNQRGIFISKHDACGKLRWLGYSNINSNLDIKGLDLMLNGNNHLQVFGKLDNANNASFDMKTIDGANQNVSLNSSNDVFSIRIALASGYFSAPTDYAIDYTDEVNDIAMDNNNMVYFAGKFGNKAEVWTYNGNNMSLLFGDNNMDNSLSAIAVNGADVYVTANLIASASFNGNSITVNGGQEAALLHYNNGTIVAHPAQAEDMRLNDLLIDNSGTIWVAGQFAGPTSWGNGLHAKYPTAIVAAFASNNINNNSHTFYIDHYHSTFEQATAIALSERNGQLYAAGTYKGQTIGMKKAQSNNLVGESGGINNHSAMWLTSIDLTQNSPSLDWINLSMSNSPIEVYDVATDGFNSYVAGAYQEDITLPPSSNLSHPANGQNLGYIIRGGAAYGQAVFYRTIAATNNQTAVTTTAHVQKEVVASSTSIMNDITSIEKTTQQDINRLHIFPNPNQGNFTVQLDGATTGEVLISIRDISNRVVYQKQMTKVTEHLQVELNPETLNQGVYILTTELNGQQQYCKFIRQ